MDVGNEREGEVEVRNSARVHMMNLWVAKEKQVMENMTGAVVNQQQIEEAAMEVGERERRAKEFWVTEEKKILEQEWKRKPQWEQEEWEMKLWETKLKVAGLWMEKLWEPLANQDFVGRLQLQSFE